MAITNFILTVGANRTALLDENGARLLPLPPLLSSLAHFSAIAFLAVVGVGAVAMLMSKDIKQSSAVLRRNMRHIRTWLEEQGAAAE